MKVKFYSKHLLVLILGCTMIGFVNAQGVQNGTINSGGSSFSNDKYIVDWSIGELSRIDTRSSPNTELLVTHGLLQPDLGRQVVYVSDPAFAPGEVKILPNPVKANLQVAFTLRQFGYVRCMLFSEKGERLFQTGFAYYGYGYNQTINMTKLATGNYFLYVELEPKEGPVIRKGSFKIVKID